MFVPPPTILKDRLTSTASPTTPIPAGYSSPYITSATSSPISPYLYPSSPASLPSYPHNHHHHQQHQYYDANTAAAALQPPPCLSQSSSWIYDDEQEQQPVVGASNDGFELDWTSSDIDEYKGSMDVYRQRGAHMRALVLLDAQVAGIKQAAVAPLTTRQAANMQYEQRQKEKAEIRAKLQQEKELYAKRPPVLKVVRLEKLAESSRKPKPKTAQDFETVAEMKCQWDLDREKIAQSKALRLLNQGFML
jgi:hypothetical protein